MIRAAVDRIAEIHLWSGEDPKPMLGIATHMQFGQIVGRPQETPEEAGDGLAFDLLAFEQDPMLDAFAETPIARRWTAPPGARVDLISPAPELQPEEEADLSRGDFIPGADKID
jgi:hypothetical protein